MIAVVDYGMGNRRSVEKAVEHVGARAAITRDHEQIRAADGVILPGVGAFPEAMRRLAELGLDDLLRERVTAGVPVLGICLGMQLLFESSSEHGGAIGLGLLAGDVGYLDTRGQRLPHIGWNLVTMVHGGSARSTAQGAASPGPRLTRGFGKAAAFYHVHSLVCRPSEEADVVGHGEYGETFASIVERGSVFGAQFHPEKSSRDGLALLRNFVGIAAKVPAA